MEGILTEDIPPFSVYVDGGSDDVIPTNKFSDVFEEALPNYMLMGMTPDEFWNGDCTLVISYRKAFELKRDYDNFQLWLQGMYVYDAIGRIAPILHPFAKKGTKPEPYPSEPYRIRGDETSTQSSNDFNNENDRKQFEKVNNYMETMMGKINSSFR